MGGEAWEAVRSGGIILTYGGVACDSAREAGEVGHVVAGHVDEMQARVAVLESGDKRAFFTADQEPMVATVCLEAAEGLPVGVGGLEVVFQEVLMEFSLREAGGDRLRVLRSRRLPPVFTTYCALQA